VSIPLSGLAASPDEEAAMTAGAVVGFFAVRSALGGDSTWHPQMMAHAQAASQPQLMGLIRFWFCIVLP